MLLELAYFAGVLVIGYQAIADQSLLEFAVFVGAILVWYSQGIFMPFRPSEIRLYLGLDEKSSKQY
jgi:hypothetical protein